MLELATHQYGPFLQVVLRKNSAHRGQQRYNSIAALKCQAHKHMVIRHDAWESEDL